MTAKSFESAGVDPDSDLPTALTIQVVSNFTDSIETGLVRVDTNYKATRTGQYPVDLSMTDAVRASAALVQFTLSACHQTDEVDALTVMRALSELDGEIQALRHVLLRDMRNATDED